MASTTEVGNLIVRLLGDDSSFQKMISKASRVTKQLGATLTAAFTAPVAGSLAAFGAFDQAMTESTSIMSVTQQQTERMREAALSLSKEAVFGPSELARSYFYLASAGLDAEQSIAALPAVTSFATAGAFDLSTATDLLTDAQSALGLASKDATQNLTNMTRVSDVLVKANTLANASVQQFSEALTTKSGAALKNFNKDVEEGVAVLAAMADQGIKAANAGENLNRLITLMAGASRDNAAAFEELGFAVFDSDGSMRNFADIIGNLETVLAGMSDEMKSATLDQLGFDARVQAAILPLIGTSDAIRRYEKELRAAGNTTKDVADKQLMSFGNQLKQTWNLIQTVAISIGEVLAPYVLKLNEWLKQAIGVWDSFNPTLKNAIVLIVGVAAALGPVLVGIGALLPVLGAIGSAIAAIVSPIGLVVAAITGAIAAVIHFGIGWDNVWEHVKAFSANVMGFFNNFQENWGKLLDWMSENWTIFSNNWGSILLKMVENLGHNMLVGINLLFRLWSAWSGFMASMWEFVFSKQMQKWAWDGMVAVGKMVIKWSSMIGQLFSSIFFSRANRQQAISQASEFLTSLTDQALNDFEAGRENLGKAVATIFKEEVGNLKGLFADTGLFTEGPDFNLSLGAEQVAKEIAAETPLTEAFKKDFEGVRNEAKKTEEAIQALDNKLVTRNSAEFRQLLARVPGAAGVGNPGFAINNAQGDRNQQLDSIKKGIFKLVEVVQKNSGQIFNTLGLS